MMLTFAKTHNMIAYLIKSDASEGFNQIINFLNGRSIKYALTVNLNIYVSCIKQFWTFVAVKNVNDIMRLQALVDKKKVTITEASIRDALRLDDAEGVECLPNEEIFTELARMGHEKPSIKLIFYKAFFSSQLVRNVDSSTKFYMYLRFLQLMIRKQVDDLSSHSTKYTSPALTQKVFANMRRVGKGLSGVDTPLFKGMLVVQEVGEGDADAVHVEDVNAAGVADEGIVSAVDDVVTTDVDEPSIPSPTLPTPPPQPSQDQPSTSQVYLTLPQSPQAQLQSPQPQPQPSHDVGLPIDLLQNLMDTCTTLTRRVEHLELDKVAQALEITKLKQRGGIISNINEDEDVVLEDAKDVTVEKSTDVDDNADIQGRKPESQTEIYKIDLEHAKKVLSMQEEESEQAKLQEVVYVVTTAKIITEVVTATSDTITAASTTITAVDVPILTATIAAAPTLTAAPSRRRKRVVIKDLQETAPTLSTIIHFEAKSKDEGKGILVEEPKPLKKQAQIEQDKKYARELEAELNKNIDWDEVIDHVKRKQKEDSVVKRYQALKRKPQTEAQARKNMMIYLRNVAGFKMDYFKGMTYDDIRPIFEKHFDSNVDFLQKTKEQIDEEDSRALKRLNESKKDKAAKKHKLDEEVKELKRHLQIVPNDEDDVYTKATPLARKVPVVDYEIYNENNKPYYKIKRANVFDGAFGGVRDEEVVVGEAVVVTSLSLETLTNSCLGGIMVSLIFLEGLKEEALVEFMVELFEEDE
nr:hypothetical protein [Tanacetum cinerariifolium]